MFLFSTHYFTSLVAFLVLALSACGDADRVDVSTDRADMAADGEADAGQIGADQDMLAPDRETPEDLGPDLPPATDLGSLDMGVDMALEPDMAGEPEEPGGVLGPARYPSDAISSPVSDATLERWRQIAAAGPATADERVFMKVGASGTVNPRLLHCFEPGSSFGYDLAGEEALQDTIDHFRQVQVTGGTTSFARASLAAEVGRGARWAVTGSPSPLTRELTALKPRYAIVNYGTNDMGGAATYEAALWVFWNHMNTLLDALEGQGVVPLVTGLNPRDDNASAAAWVPVFDALTRGIAEQRQVPYLSLYRATKDLANMGLISDGIHGNTYASGGAARPCHFTQEGLEFNYNIRNLETLRALDRARRALAGQQVELDADTQWQGSGTKEDPYRVDTLPFTHHASTVGRARLNARYPSCDNNQDEGGGEVYYRLTLSEPKRVRFLVFDREADVDVHLLEGGDEAQDCVARHDRTIERELPAGVHTLVVDSFVAGGVAQEGDFLLVAVER